VSQPLTVSDFDYVLPAEVIAQTPAAERGASRLLHLDSHGGLHDRQFADLIDLLHPGDLLVFNDTRVIKARLNGQKATGGKVEVLVERITEPDRALAHVRASKSPGPGMVLRLADAFDVVVLGREGELFDLRFPQAVLNLLDAHGATPLPPYITHAADAVDDSCYQTVHAREPGAVAAPTAGLHFDQAMLERLQARGVERAFVTLHVGAGTFRPVRVQNLADHIMHAEFYTVPQATVDAIAHVRAQASGSSRSARPASERWNRLHTMPRHKPAHPMRPYARRRAILVCSLRRAIATGSSTRWSPIFTYRNPSCLCWFPPSRALIPYVRPTFTPWRNAIVFSATATLCLLNLPPYDRTEL
jgi:S-adenosylmethionine:tRNA ribosyltransferase-isomerase